MNIYYDSLKRLYDTGKLDAVGVHKAVGRGWITEDEYREIVGLTPEPAEEVAP